MQELINFFKMKKYFSGLIVFSIFFISALFSCRNTDEENDTDKQDSLVADSAITDIPVWELGYDTVKNDIKITTLKPLNRDTLQPGTVVNFLNENYPDVIIKMVKISNDTLYTKIPESTHLTTRMGSAGADHYLKAATYLLTELKNINYVAYDFTEADHAVPGVYARKDWQAE